MSGNRLISNKLYNVCGYQSLDLLKFIMAIMIVAMHTGACPAIVNPWFRIAVPLFFIVSSFFFFKKVNATDESERTEVLKHYLGRVIKLYFFWMVIQFPVNIILSWNSLMVDGIVLMPLYLLRKILFTGMFGASWFLMALIYGIPIIFYLSKFLSNKYILLITFVLNVIVVFQSSYANVFEGAIRFRELSLAVLGTNLEFSFLVALLWIEIGKLLAEHISEIKISSVWLSIMVVFLIVLLFFENKFIDENNLAIRHDTYFMLIALCPLVFILCSRFQINLKYSYQLRKLSTVLYCMHFTLKECISLSLLKMFDYHISGQMLFLSVLLICLTVGLLIVNVLGKNNNLKILKYAC